MKTTKVLTAKMPEKGAKPADRMRRYLKTELKRADVAYEGSAERLAKHGLKGETTASIKNKLMWGTFAATFLLATLAALELEGVKLEDI